MDATLMGRCGTQNWTGFEKTLAACCATGPATVKFRNRAGRTLDAAFVGEGVLHVVLLAHPTRSDALRADGWTRSGRGQGPVSRAGRDTGAVPGSPLARTWTGHDAGNLIAKLITLLKEELPVVEPRDLHFEVDVPHWAQLLRVPATGHEHRWHHRTEAPADAGTGSGAGGERGPTQCRRCGQYLADR
jgi:hypothetical protein